MKKWIVLAVVLLLALGSYVAAGPYLTVRAIGEAVRAQDAGALARQVDFPALRGSIKAQLAERIARETGTRAQASPLAAFGVAIANGLAGGAVDALVTPTGLAALMQGRKAWDRASGVPMPGSDDALVAPPEPRPLHDAVTRFESTSRFTATVTDDDGRPLVFVITRKGITWRLSDIRLPLGP